MNELFLFAAHNTIAALVLACVVYGVTRVWRNPAVAHLLWLLVLLKLVAPPVMRVDWSALLPSTPTNVVGRLGADARPNRLPTMGPQARHSGDEPKLSRPLDESSHRPAEQPKGRMTVDGPPSGPAEEAFVDRLRSMWENASSCLFGIWVGGGILCALVAARRIVRFERLLRDTLPASDRLRRRAQEIAETFHIRRLPDLRYAECVDVPLLWCAGRRPTIVLPMRLLREFDETQSALILAHELAHLHRRDHWVRAVELVVSTVYWWNPLAWLVRRQIHRAEDYCCDAWVRLAFPDRQKSYAEVVLKTAEWLSASRLGPRWLPASPFLHSRSLKARIEMILTSRFNPSLSARFLIAAALAGLLVLPSFVQRTAEIRAASSENASPAPVSKPGAPSASEFPYAVRFEKGATQFEKGDAIVLLEVRGTADTITPGNLYCIKGNYTLESHDRAMLAAFTTAREAKDGFGPSLKVQTIFVNKGTGTFTVFFPMSCDGWPHVSFYPANGGESFGGNYFGTGKTVLKQMWSSSHGTAAYDTLIRQIKIAGGQIEQEEGPNGPVSGVRFSHNSHIKDQDILRLQVFNGLSTVDLGHTGITDAGMANLAEVEKGHLLARLSLRSAARKDAGRQASPELRELTTLYIDNTPITDAGVKALKDLPKLRTLGLGHTRTSDAGLQTVRQLTNLTHLYIDNTQITDAGVEMLGQLKSLTTLGLGHTATSDAALKTVGKLTSLTHLYIDNTRITDAGLAELKNLKELDTLGLGHTRITDAGLESLEGLKNLAVLYLDHTQTTDAGIQKLKDALPSVKIVR